MNGALSSASPPSLSVLRTCSSPLALRWPLTRHPSEQEGTAPLGVVSLEARMSFNPTYALMDGTLRNPAVLAAVLATSVLAGIAGWAVVRLASGSTPWRWGRYTVLVVASPVFLLLSPLSVTSLINAASGAGPGSDVFLCLMPTHDFVRDFGPGLVGSAAGALAAWRGERATRAA